MGLFEKWKHKKAAKEAGVELSVYLRYIELQKSYQITLEHFLLLESEQSMTAEQRTAYLQGYAEAYSPSDFLLLLQARSLHLTVEQYLEYQSRFADSMTVQEYLGFCQARKINITLEEYQTFLGKYKDVLTLDRYRRMLDAQKHAMTLELYERYLAEYRDKMSPQQFLLTVKAQEIGLSVEEYQIYTDDMRRRYTPEQFHKYCEAKRYGLTLEQYGEWERHHQDVIPVERFREYLEACQMGMTLAEYEEFKQAKALGMSIPAFRVYQAASALGLSVENYQVYTRLQEEQKTGDGSLLIRSDSELKMAKRLGAKRIVLDLNYAKMTRAGRFENAPFEEIVLPWGITKIGEHEFRNCKALRRIVFPGSIKQIPGHVLDGCRSLTEIVLMQGIQQVDITGWEALLHLKAVVSDPNISEITYAMNGLPAYYCCKDIQSYDERSAMENKKTTIRYLEIGGSWSRQYDQEVRISGQLFWAPDIRLQDMPLLEVLHITCDSIGKLELKNCPRLKVILIDNSCYVRAEYYKNGNIKSISEKRYSAIEIPEALPSLQFFLIRSGTDPVSVEKLAAPLKWLHLSSGKSPSSDASGMLQALGVSDRSYWDPFELKGLRLLLLHGLFSGGIPCCAESEGMRCYTCVDPKWENKAFEKQQWRHLQIMEGVTALPEDFFARLHIQELTLPYSLKTIQKDLFTKCDGLQKIRFLSMPEAIEVQSLNGCKTLKTIEAPDLPMLRRMTGAKQISLQNFQTCPALPEMVPDHFFGNSGIHELVIPAHVKAIGNKAFADSKQLTRIVFEGAPEAIAQDAFEGCISVREIVWGRCTRFAIAGKTGFPLIEEVSVPEGTAEIPDNAFLGWGLTKLRLPQSVKRIGKKSFAKCSKLLSFDTAEQGHLRLPADVQCEDDAFLNTGIRCFDFTEERRSSWTSDLRLVRHSGMTHVNIPDTFPFMLVKELTNCQSLERIVCYSGQSTEQTESGTIEHIPKTMQTLHAPRCVEALADGCFAKGAALECLVLPDETYYVPKDLFRCCPSLKKLVISVDAIGRFSKKEIPDTVQIQTVGEAHPQLAELYIPNDAAFSEIPRAARYLTQKVILGNRVTKIPSRSFYGFWSLKEVSIPRSCTVIGEGAFQDCTALSAVKGMRGIREIGKAAFRNCCVLKALVFYPTISRIEDAFQGCTSLQKLIVPSDLEMLHVNLSSAEKLETVYLPLIIQDYSCKIAGKHPKLVIYVRRGSIWRKQLPSEIQVVYPKQAEYEAALKKELGGFPDAEMPAVTQEVPPVSGALSCAEEVYNHIFPVSIRLRAPCKENYCLCLYDEKGQEVLTVPVVSTSQEQKVLVKLPLSIENAAYRLVLCVLGSGTVLAEQMLAVKLYFTVPSGE